MKKLVTLFGLLCVVITLCKATQSLEAHFEPIPRATGPHGVFTPMQPIVAQEVEEEGFVIRRFAQRALLYSCLLYGTTCLSTDFAGDESDKQSLTVLTCSDVLVCGIVLFEAYRPFMPLLSRIRFRS